MTDLKEIALKAMHKGIVENRPALDEEIIEAILDALREAGALIEWRENTESEAQKLSRELDSDLPVHIGYAQVGKLKDWCEMSAIDAHLYSPFGATHFALIHPPKEKS